MNPDPETAARLQDILATLYEGGMSRDEARSEVIDLVRSRLGCQRVSLWKEPALQPMREPWATPSLPLRTLAANAAPLNPA